MIRAGRRLVRRVAGAYVDAFRGLPRPIWSLSAVLLVNRAGSMVLVFLALYLTQDLGWELTTAGSIVALHGLGAVIGSLVGGWLTDRIGACQVMTGGLALSGVGYSMLELPRTPWTLGLLVLAASIASESFRPANLAALAELAPPGLEARAVALARLAINLGMAIGPSVGGFLSIYGYHWLFRIDGATCLLAAVTLLLLFRHPEAMRPAISVESPESTTSETPTDAPPTPQPTSRPASAGLHPLKDRAFLLFLGLTVINVAIFFQAFSTFPVALKTEHGLPESHFGLVMATNAVLILVFEMLLVKRFEGHPPLRLVALGAVFTGVGFALLEIGRGWAVALLSVTVWTVGEMLISPFAIGWVTLRTRPRTRGKYMGLYTTSWGVGFALGPLAGSWVYDHWGGRALWLGIGVLALLSAAGFELLGRRTAPEESPTSFAGNAE